MCVCVCVGVCVCVCVGVCGTLLPRASKHTLLYIAGGQPREHSWLRNEEGFATADTGSDQPSVPARHFASVVCKCFLQCHGLGLSLEPRNCPSAPVADHLHLCH